MQPEHIEAAKSKMLCFLKRDHESDAIWLNKNFANNSFAPVAPIPYSSDPFSLQAGNCIVVLGLNPKLPQKMCSAGSRTEHGAELSRLSRYVEEIRNNIDSSLEVYIQDRKSYFAHDNKEYYGRYFTKLGNLIGRNFLDNVVSLDNTGPFVARTVFDKYVFKADVLPWFSTNTNGLDVRKLVQCINSSEVDTPLNSYYEFLRFVIVALKPKWIQCNGLQMWEATKCALDVVESFDSKPTQRSGPRWLKGYARVRSRDDISVYECPIFAHRFSNRLPYRDFEVVASEFRNFVGSDSALFFSDRLQKQIC